MIKLQTTIDLFRVEENFDYGTFGVWLIDKQVFCVTLEPKDEENAPNISSIPAQQYICKKRYSAKFDIMTFEIMDVPERTDVILHPLNIVSQTKACIGLAQHFGKLGKDRAILNSGNTFKKFMEIMKDVDEFLLTIHEVY